MCNSLCIPILSCWRADHDFWHLCAKAGGGHIKPPHAFLDARTETMAFSSFRPPRNYRLGGPTTSRDKQAWRVVHILNESLPIRHTRYYPARGLPGATRKARRQQHRNWPKKPRDPDKDNTVDVDEIWTAGREAQACGAQVLLGDRNAEVRIRSLVYIGSCSCCSLAAGG